ncbi:hypothetical protein Plhal304r1_c006g0023511 [Plasmopara halstedii]
MLTARLNPHDSNNRHRFRLSLGQDQVLLASWRLRCSTAAVALMRRESLVKVRDFRSILSTSTRVADRNQLTPRVTTT